MTDVKSNELGFIGNVWVRQNILEKSVQSNQGHKHKFDHVSLLTSGKVCVEVDGYAPKEFTAPTFIVIKKEHNHKFTALADNTVWYCVFAMRDLDGNVTDIYGHDNSPYTQVLDKSF
jgi:quercetin dioxygenase-like cupin family protein